MQCLKELLDLTADAASDRAQIIGDSLHFRSTRFGICSGVAEPIDFRCRLDGSLGGR